MSSLVPLPSAPRTRTGKIMASGAVPATPIPLSVAAAAMPAVCVPWPFSSCGPAGQSLLPATKSLPATSLLFRSGWFRSTPVSTIAMVTPAPSTPRAQACGAWIC